MGFFCRVVKKRATFQHGWGGQTYKSWVVRSVVWEKPIDQKRYGLTKKTFLYSCLFPTLLPLIHIVKISYSGGQGEKGNGWKMCLGGGIQKKNRMRREGRAEKEV